VRIGVRLPPCRPLPEVAAAARRAEEAGFDAVTMPDSPTLWRDTLSALAYAATVTERVTLWTSVTNVVTRQPAGLASSARTVAELADGRFHLGLGAADSSVFLTGQRPARTSQLREGVLLIRDLLEGRTGHVGETEVLLQDPCGPVPIYLAAEGPRNLALAAEVADGVITTYRDIEAKAGRIAGAVAAAGRERPLHHVAVSFVKVTDDVEQEAQKLKPRIVVSIQNEGPELFESAGFEVSVPAESIRLADGTDLGHPRDLEEAIRVASQWIPDDVATWYAHHIGLFGTPEEIVAGIDRLAAFGVQQLHITDGESFDLPVELIDVMGSDVIPRLRTA
jgi:5,10-methylenetetrahydromethanopterin reductase